MATFNVYKGTALNTTKVPVKDGQLLFETDTRKIWLDAGTERIQVGGGTITTGSANGTIAVDGVDIPIKGLGSNAYTSTAYLPSAGGIISGDLQVNGVFKSLNTLRVGSSTSNQYAEIDLHRMSTDGNHTGILCHYVGADTTYSGISYVYDGNTVSDLIFKIGYLQTNYPIRANLEGNATTASSLSSREPTLSTGHENSAITIKGNANGALGLDSYVSLRTAIDFKWYDDYWQIGNLRSSGTSSYGFGFACKKNGEESFSLKARITTDSKLILGEGANFYATLGPNSISSYGNLYLAGAGKGNYYGIHLGDSIDYMTLMSGVTHQGLFNEANNKWIMYYNRENDRIGLGTSSVEGYTVTVSGSLKADNLYGNLHGNAATATKLATARTITLDGQFTGSASFDGSSNINLVGRLKYCSVTGNGTANFPYHRIAYGMPGTGAYVDSYAILLISANYAGGIWGIIKIGHRTNNSGSSVSYTAEWLVRSNGMPEDAITIASYGTSVTNNVYFDVFYKVTSSWPRITVTALGPTADITLVNSNESSSTTATEAWATIAAAGTALHGQAYSSSATSTQTAIYGAVWN